MNAVLGQLEYGRKYREPAEEPDGESDEESFPEPKMLNTFPI